MSITVTLDTISDSSAEFIRDVIRQNLTDTQATPRSGSSWIFKSLTEKKVLDYPFVIINVDSASIHKRVFGNNYIGASLIVHIEVWADKLHDRDTISDEAVKILRNVNSADSDSKTLGNNKLFFIDSNEDIDDRTDVENKLIRIKLIDVEMDYGGL